MTLASYPDQKANLTHPVSVIINEAWELIRNDPERFLAWEVTEIEELQSLGLY